MRKLLMLLGVIVLSSIALLAQGQGGAPRTFPGGGQGGFPGGGGGTRGGGMFMNRGSSGATVVSTAYGLFVLDNGVLAKYDNQTLKLRGQLELFQGGPKRPEGDPSQNPDAWRNFAQEASRRSGQGVMIAKEGSLLIIQGDMFVRVKQQTMEKAATANLAPKASASGASSRGASSFGFRPGYTLVNNTLYVVEPTEVLSVDTITGKILSRSELPKSMQAQADMPGGGRSDGQRQSRAGR